MLNFLRFALLHPDPSFDILRAREMWWVGSFEAIYLLGQATKELADSAINPAVPASIK